MTIHRLGPLVIAAVLALALGAGEAEAYFERIVVSSRTASLGGAFVALADDPASVIMNPAGLTQMRSAGILTTVGRPYEASDLEEYLVAGSFRTRFGSFGASWHRFGLGGVCAEDLFTFAYGRDLIRTAQDASLAFGGALDLARVSYDETYDSKTAVTGSLGVLLRPFPIIGLGYTVRHLGEPSFDLLRGGGATRLETTHAYGVSYHWERRVVAAYERLRGQDGAWRDAIGLEVQAGEALRFRAGLEGSDLAGGLGVSIADIVFDAAVTSHDVLGLSYVVSVGYSFPAPPGPGGVQW